MLTEDFGWFHFKDYNISPKLFLVLALSEPFYGMKLGFTESFCFHSDRAGDNS